MTIAKSTPALRVAAISVGLLVFGGCGGGTGAGTAGRSSGPPATPSAAATPPAAAVQRVPPGAARAAVAPADGRAALIMLASADAAPTVRVRVGDGPEAVEPVWRVEPVMDDRPVTGPLARMRDWLGMPIRWQAAPASAPKSDAAGDGIAVVALPARSGVAAARISIDDRSMPIRWLPPLSGSFDFASPGGGSDPGNRWLLAALEPARQQPWSLWRTRLASSKLGPIGAPGAIEQPVDAARDSIVERLGVQHAAVWSVALQRLSAADRDAVRRLVIRMGGAVNFGNGVWAPVWTNWPGPAAAEDGLSLLRDDLLADDLSSRERAARARAWIDSLPAGAAWVIDDAGVRDSASGQPITTLALANLTDAPAAASVSRNAAGDDDAGPPLEMRTLPPMSVVPISVAAGNTREDTGADVLDVRIGDWSGRVTAVGRAVPARPPGVRIGPLIHDLDMPQVAAAALTGGDPPVRVPAADRATVGMLQRDQGSDGSVRWVMYVECTQPARQAGDASPASRDDVLLLAMGPASAGGVRWRIASDGSVEVVDGDRARNAAATAATRVSPEMGRWRCWITLPPSAIEDRRWLRLALAREVRVGDRVERTAWPRPVAPWIDTTDMPARLLIDLSAWGQ